VFIGSVIYRKQLFTPLKVDRQRGNTYNASAKGGGGATRSLTRAEHPVSEQKRPAGENSWEPSE